jgi:hypothetical protein
MLVGRTMKGFFFFIPIAIGPTAFACELCRDAVVSGSTGANVSFNTSIYWMLGGLAGVMTVVGRLMYKTVNEVEARSPDMLRRR